MIVLKFGGTSLATEERIRRACGIIEDAYRNRGAVAVVCSAFGGATDRLVEMAELAGSGDGRFRQLLADFAERHRRAAELLTPVPRKKRVLDRIEGLLADLEWQFQEIYRTRDRGKRAADSIMSFGERLSTTIVAEALPEDMNAVYLHAPEVIRTDDHFGHARVDMETTARLVKAYFRADDRLPIVTGFLGGTAGGEITTLGRNGSDYTAALIGAALGCRGVELWTDVDGFMTADPRKVAAAFPLPALSFAEAMELARYGAKVVFPPTLDPIQDAGVTLIIRNSFHPERLGTLIDTRVPDHEYAVSGITSVAPAALIQIKGSGTVEPASVAAALLARLSEDGPQILLMSQTSTECTVCLHIRHTNGKNAIAEIAESLKAEYPHAALSLKTDCALIALVGRGMRGRPDVAGRVLEALGQRNIHVPAMAQAASELTLSLAVEAEHENDALHLLHQVFFEPAKVTP